MTRYNNLLPLRQGVCGRTEETNGQVDVCLGYKGTPDGHDLIKGPGLELTALVVRGKEAPLENIQ